MFVKTTSWPGCLISVFLSNVYGYINIFIIQSLMEMIGRWFSSDFFIVKYSGKLFLKIHLLKIFFLSKANNGRTGIEITTDDP